MAKKETHSDEFLQVLEKELTIKAASAKTGIARQTIYRWMNDSKTFKKAVSEAIKNCVLEVNDDCEANVLKKIRGEDMNAIKFWLKYHHPDYRQSYIITRQK